jgi:CCR4-NOT transcription complex subunit 7/8
LTDEVQWVCFHGVFDFAYLLKMLTGEDLLPSNDFEFKETLQMYFPHIYDLKVLAQPHTNLNGSLAKLCQELNVFCEYEFKCRLKQ